MQNKINKTNLFPKSINGFIPVPYPLIHDVQRGVLDNSDIYLYVLLKTHFPDCFASIATLATLSNVDESTISRQIKRLKEAGHIRRKQRCGTSATTEFLTDWKKGKLQMNKSPEIDEKSEGQKE